MKFMSKSIAKKIPIAGIAAGTTYAIEKAIKKDWSGAGMEFSSGFVSMFPIAGTSVSLGIDFAILYAEIYQEVYLDLCF